MISADEVRQRFQEADLQAITGGDESVITRAINSARIWLQAALGARGMELNEENEVQREIIVKRTLYELYAYSQDWEVAKANREEAKQMLLAMLGEVGDNKPSVPFVRVVRGQTDWRGFE